jgi:hypothetical protein
MYFNLPNGFRRRCSSEHGSGSWIGLNLGRAINSVSGSPSIAVRRLPGSSSRPQCSVSVERPSLALIPERTMSDVRLDRYSRTLRQPSRDGTGTDSISATEISYEARRRQRTRLPAVFRSTRLDQRSRNGREPSRYRRSTTCTIDHRRICKWKRRSCGRCITARK